MFHISNRYFSENLTYCIESLFFFFRCLLKQHSVFVLGLELMRLEGAKVVEYYKKIFFFFHLVPISSRKYIQGRELRDLTLFMDKST